MESVNKPHLGGDEGGQGGQQVGQLKSFYSKLINTLSPLSPLKNMAPQSSREKYIRQVGGRREKNRFRRRSSYLASEKDC